MPSKRLIRPEDCYRLRSISDPQMSPDGRWVACVISRPDREKDVVLSDIWLIATDGSRRLQLTNRTHKDSNPRWSQDGSCIAFVAPESDDEKAKPQVWVIPATGGEARMLTSLKQGVSNPVWSPDGSTIAFLARDARPDDDRDPKAPKLEENVGRLFATDVKVVEDIRYRSLAVLPKPEHRHIYVVSVGGGTPKQLTTGDFDDFSPAWSPDGHMIAFVSRRHRNADWENESDIYSIPSSGGEPRRITSLAGGAWSPVWSPDGTRLAFIGSMRERLSLLEAQVYVQEIGDAPVCLTSSLDELCFEPCWAADGQSVLFLMSEEGYTSLWCAGLSGALSRILPKERCVGDYSVAGKTGATAFLHATPDHPNELFVVSETTGCKTNRRGERMLLQTAPNERRLTEENAELLAEIRLAKTEQFWCESFDGMKVQGWVVKPTGFRQGKQYPLVLMAHGGPYGHFGYDWHLDAQVLAAHGFVVVYANPRGSTSYGGSFLRAAVSKWGQGDARDYIAALDFIIAQGYVDPARVGVIGQSFGGFMTMWLLATTDRFAAGVSRCGVSDQRLYYFTSDMPRWREDEFGGPPWECAEAFRAASPSTYLHNVTAPLLLLHAEDDTRVPITQSEIAFVTLKRRGIPTTFVRYPSGNHGFHSSCPRYLCDTLNRTVDWFERYLKR